MNEYQTILTAVGSGGVVAIFAWLLLKNLIDTQKSLMDLFKGTLLDLVKAQASVTSSLDKVADKLDLLCKQVERNK